MEPSDAALVAESLTGNREAFGRIVARYQTLVCALAYSATGSLSQSEDLAQDTFVAAWKQLDRLREPHKLRAWLCQIARNLACAALKQQGREPSHAAAPLEEISELRSPEPPPAERAITNEEQAILWRSLELIPEIYREPLILYYRDHQSVTNVATALDLNDNAVKQRLARGRKLLHDQVLAFVEGALAHTNPGRTFTLGVLAALPLTAASAKAAAAGTALAKGGATVKSAATLGFLGGGLALLGGGYLSLRAVADDTKSPRERQFILQVIGLRIIAFLLTLAVLYGLETFGLFQEPLARAAFVFSVVIVGTGFLAWSSRCQRRIQIEEGTFVAAEWNSPRLATEAAAHSLGSASKIQAHLKIARFMALGLVLCAGMIARAPWQQHPGQSFGLLAIVGLTVFLSCRSWQNRPRYHSLRSGWVMLVPVLLALMTLLCFNLQQYRIRAGADAAGAASPAALLVFNFGVVLACAAFAGLLVWLRKRD